MTSGASGGAQGAGWPYPAALNVSAPSWQSDLAQQGQVPLSRPTITIGSDPSCDIAIFDSAVAPRHAVISWVSGGYQIEDQGSITGTSVQGQRIYGRTPLALGQTIHVGGAALLVISPRADEVTLAAAPAPTRVAGPAAPTSQPPAMNLGTPVRVAGMPPAAPPQPAPVVLPPSPTPPFFAPQQPTGPVRYAAPGQPPAPFSQQPPAQPPMYTVPPGQPWPPLVAPQIQSPVAITPVPQPFNFGAWLQAQQPRFYWKFFLVALGVLIVAEFTASNASNPIAVPLIILLYSALVPVTFVIFCWEQGAAAADISPILIVAAFGCGATVGLILGSTLDSIFNANAGTLFAAVLIGVAEESGKIAALAYFMRDPRLRREIHGLLLGAASGMGFAALETAGYGFVAFVQGTQGGTFGAALDAANQQLLARMLLAVFGHGVWTAIVASAIWRERGHQAFAITRGVVIAFIIAICLHGLWDFSIGQAWLPITIGNAIYPGFDILIVGPLGLVILGFFLRESIQQARMGSAAPPPPPLDDALKAYFNALFSRFGARRTIAPAQPYSPPAPGGYYSPPPAQPGPYNPYNPTGPAPNPAPSPAYQPPAYPAPLASPPQTPLPAVPPLVRQAPAMQPAAPAEPQWPTPQPPPVWPLPPPQPTQPPPAEPPAVATVPYYARCGIKYSAGATYCANCGSKLTQAIVT
jgi:RsiW-degrading membrane proteinase PrsW (M82 family)